MTDNKTKFSRRAILGSTSGALLYSSIGTVSAEETGGSSKSPKHSIPHDISITNNGAAKHKLTFTLTNSQNKEVVYERQVVLAGLNDKGRQKSQAVRKKYNVNVPTGKTYKATLKDDSGLSKTFEWYIPSEGTGHISLSSSIDPDDTINFVNRVI